jgi:hypothetical protein
MKTLSLGLVLVACATTTPPPQGGPRGPRASDHLAAARQHDEIAQDRKTWPATQAMTPGTADVPSQAPWFRTWDTSAEHENLARTHRGRAAALQAAFDDACRDRSGLAITVSPLERFGIGGWNTTTGAVVYLDAAAGSADELLAAMRCHRAWMMLSAAGMEDCALDLPGLVLDARGDPGGITLAITVNDRKLIAELQRRVAKQLEARTRNRR